ncbi:MAG TPA: proline dehydrogenase family protein [Prolixibacteraceae bacterium]|nr:proline dehydrogenase [Bacteroidales bacterium]HPJ77930.1 proline dehydrogenase family protein [Prolixibacteraceae bacterium]HRV88641.1 proline dehydrogenase family protein [Prolixibacteraceae bacterium]
MFNKFIASILPYFPAKLIWIFSCRYIAGTKIEDGIRVSKELNAGGAVVTSDLLGEFIKSMEEAESNRDEYLRIIDRFTAEGVKGNFSVKPTMFGLLIDQEACYRHIREVVRKAAEKGSFIRIDMEDSQCVDMEIALYRKLKAEFPRSVGLVVQAYMRRTLSDLEALMDVHTPESPLNFRLCKGIYIEPESIAYKGYQEVRDNFLLLLDFMLKHKIYVGIATHDKYLIDHAYRLIEQHGAGQGDYEFQMLYGVTPELRSSVIQKGHLMRVYVPFGEKWFGYSTRRLKENPKMASHIIKALFIRG